LPISVEAMRHPVKDRFGPDSAHSVHTDARGALTAFDYAGSPPFAEDAPGADSGCLPDDPERSELLGGDDRERRMLDELAKAVTDIV